MEDPCAYTLLYDTILYHTIIYHTIIYHTIIYLPYYILCGLLGPLVYAEPGVKNRESKEISIAPSRDTWFRGVGPRSFGNPDTILYSTITILGGAGELVSS